MRAHRQALAFATAFLTLPLLSFSQQTPMAGQQAAQLMKPVRAILIHELDAAKDKQGYTFKARLDQKVVLTDGTELPKNTILLGKVTQDDMQQNGLSKLALRFDTAELKDGKAVPVRASIVGFYSPGSMETAVGDGENAQMPNSWTSMTTQTDQVNALNGVDLHSRISSNNSGVFVSTKKDDVKLPAGSELQFAIGPAQS